MLCIPLQRAAFMLEGVDYGGEFLPSFFFVRKGLVESESMFGDLQKEILNRTNRRNMTAELRKMVSIHGHLRKATANKHYE